MILFFLTLPALWRESLPHRLLWTRCLWRRKMHLPRWLQRPAQKFQRKMEYHQGQTPFFKFKLNASICSNIFSQRLWIAYYHLKRTWVYLDARLDLLSLHVSRKDSSFVFHGHCSASFFFHGHCSASFLFHEYYSASFSYMGTAQHHFCSMGTAQHHFCSSYFYWFTLSSVFLKT